MSLTGIRQKKLLPWANCHAIFGRFFLFLVFVFFSSKMDLFVNNKELQFGIYKSKAKDMQVQRNKEEE